MSYFKSPSRIVEELGIESPHELNMEAIAQYCNATVVYEPVAGCEARILGFHDRAIITISSSSSRARQRFSIGHELGHWMRDRHKVGFSCTERDFTSKWRMNDSESKANEFAAELLMPESMFSMGARNLPITFESVDKLAGIFQTSRTATAIRLVEKGSFPAMLIYLENGQRKWFVRGPDVPNFIWPCDKPKSGSLAHDLWKGTGSEEGPLDVYADNWLTAADSKRYGLSENSKLLPSGAILTLLWWKDETQLLEITRNSY